jgi:DNA repair protein RadA/Sms
MPIAEAVARRRERLLTGIDEFDRVVGGGLVPGSAILLGGAPGVGKSTVVLQIGAAFARRGVETVIASGEESRSQIGRRARRIGAVPDGLSVTAESDALQLAELIREGKYAVVVVDSIQTLRGATGESAVGSATRIRESVALLIAAAKETGAALMLIGHVTKDGMIAGPKALEHMVDVVLALDGDSHRNLRFLRGTKNRFGSINDIGVFEMTGTGLEPIRDPSAVLSETRDEAAAGSVLFPTVDGRRSLVVEVQALVVPTRSAQPRRSVKGLPPSRVHQVLAALERHGRFPMSGREVYVSVMGGMSVNEPAADLPTALAVASAFTGNSLGSVAAWGEVGLTGEVRAVDQSDRRRAEVERLGIERTVEAGEHRRLSDILSRVGVGLGADRHASGLHSVATGGGENPQPASPVLRMD